MTPSRRAKNQDAAIEAAFLAGTLPEEDRRAVVEWVRHGDGNEYPYRDGQRIADPHEVAELRAARQAEESA